MSNWVRGITVAAAGGALVALFCAVTAGCAGDSTAKPAQQIGASRKMTEKVKKSDQEWQKDLTPQQFHVARKKGTEAAFSGAYWDCHKKGVYRCVCCGAELFDSSTKFDSGTGWPSFWQPVKADHVATESDSGFGMVRTEVTCSNCGAHLGHVFEDGPAPTNLRYCINSASLKLEEKP